MAACVLCESGRHDRCPRLGCDCLCRQSSSERSAPSGEPPPAQAARRPDRKSQCTGKPGGPHGARIARELAHAIAVDLLAICACGVHPLLTKPQISAKHGVTYEQVRTVQRNLEALGGRRSCDA